MSGTIGQEGRLEGSSEADEGSAEHRWTTLDQEVLIDRWWIRLRRDRVRLPDGEVIPEFHVIEYPDWALTVCLTEERELVMVEQYRYGADRLSLEFAAGALEEGEVPRTGAERELLEETGYEAAHWHRLGRCAPEPSKHTNFAHLFVATGARRVAEPETDATESLRVRTLPVEEVRARAGDGTLVHGIHLTALFWALDAELI